MSETIRFFVPGAARGKARARVVAGHTYTPETTVQAERGIAWSGKKAMSGRPPIEGPVYLNIVARYHYPNSWSKKRRDLTIWKTSKPDFDNIEKLATDALKGICWLDDAQVAWNQTIKCYVTEKHPEQGLTVEIGVLSDA